MLTSSQIVSLANQISKTQGFTSQAGQFLNLILQNLAMDFDFDVNRSTTTINTFAGTPSYSLPADWIRTREVFYNIGGEIFMPNQITLQEYDSLFAGPGSNDYPYSYATDPSTSTIYFYPFPVVNIPVTLRYMKLPTDISAPESSSAVPWFPDQDTLVHLLATRMMKIADDSRLNDFEKIAEDMLRKFKIMVNDPENMSKTVSLDRRQFRVTAGLKPTKRQP